MRRPPPRTAGCLLRLLLPASCYESVAGDLAELWNSGRISRLCYWRLVLGSIVACRLDREAVPAPVTATHKGDGPMRTILQDLHYGLRLLGRAPGFTLAAVLTLALGIGVNTATFSLLNVLTMKPLSYRAPERVAFILGWNQDRQEMRFNLPLADVDAIAGEATSLGRVGAYRYWDANLSGGGRPERLQAYRVTGSTFPLLGVKPLYGRTLQPSDARADAADVVVLGYRLWERRFGATPAVIGDSIRLDDRSYTIVGVMPQAFEFPVFNFKGDLWVPLKRTPSALARSSSPSVVAIARLKEGVSYAQAGAEVGTIMARLAKDYPETNRGLGARVMQMRRLGAETIAPAIAVLVAAVALILLLACANVANLLLARASTRTRELALRSALGAGRLRLVRQLLTESLLLAAGGAATGLLAAFWALRTLRAWLPEMVRQTVPNILDLGVDHRTLAFTLGLAVFSTLLFGMVPALRAARLDLNASLTQRGQGMGRGHRGLRAGLIVAEIAISLVLLVSAGLLARSFARLQHVDLGFNPEHVATLTVSLPPYRYPDGAALQRFFENSLQRVRQVPGVRAAGFVNTLPFSTYNRGTGYQAQGQAKPRQGQKPHADYRVVTPGYFAALELPLRAGRVFTSGDRASAAPVAIVNQRLARQAFGEESPLGRRIRLDRKEGAPWRTIVGVVGDVRHSEVSERPAPEVFVPFAQAPGPMMMLAARTEGRAGALTSSLVAAIAAVDPVQPVYHVQTLHRLVEDALLLQASAASMMSFLGTLALLLATIGIYGVISYAVSQQLGEFGIRLALGAAPIDLLRLVLRRGLVLIGSGAFLGLLAAIGVGRLMAGLLYGVTPSDPVSFAGALALLAGVAATACLIPAFRAMRIDPAAVLKTE